MGTIHTFPDSPAQIAWRQYAALCREIRARPMLAEDPEHYEKRRQAYRRFCAAFTGEGQR